MMPRLKSSSVGDGNLSLSSKPAKTFDPKASLPGVLVLRDEGGAERFLQIGDQPREASALASPAVFGRTTAGRDGKLGTR